MRQKRKLRKRHEQPFRATDQCQNCGDEFANHEYVRDSITQYKCPVPNQDSSYGYGYRNINPNQYFPDYECCTPEEIQRWKDACTIVNRGDVYAGGMGLVAACDMAVSVETANFCLSEVKLGLIPATISPYVIHAIGERAARRAARRGPMGEADIGRAA